MKILVIDDHELFRAGLRMMLDKVAESVQVHEANSCEAALEMADADFDMVLLDMHLGGISGLQSLRLIKQRFASAFVVVVSGDASEQLICSAIGEGACGYMIKSMEPSLMVKALQLVLARGSYIPAQVLRQHFGADPAQAMLQMTPRQIQVLRLLLRGGGGNKSIARELDVAEGTVKSHLSTIYRLLNVRSRTEVVLSMSKLPLDALPGEQR